MKTSKLVITATSALLVLCAVFVVQSVLGSRVEAAGGVVKSS